jgi:hypothetical protein
MGGLTLVTIALLSLLQSQGEGHKGEVEKKYNARLLGCPVTRHCPSGRIEVEPHYLA